MAVTMKCCLLGGYALWFLYEQMFRGTVPQPLSRLKEAANHENGSSNKKDLLVTANVLTSKLILFNLMIKAISSSETSFLTKAKWHHVSEDSILQYLFQFAKSRKHLSAVGNPLVPISELY
jgi:hypothetical protein